MNYTFKRSVLWTGESGQWLLSGLIVTLELSALAWLLAVALGIVSGALRTVKFRPLRALATFYVEFFRNVPLLVWMFFWYFAVPPVLPEMIREWMFGHGLEFWAGVCALGVYSGARFSEVLRSGIQSIPKTQMEAAVASGLTTFQSYRYVILPVALRIIIPLTRQTPGQAPRARQAMTDNRFYVIYARNAAGARCHSDGHGALRARAWLGPHHLTGGQPREQRLAEAFVGTFKRDYLGDAELRDAETVLVQKHGRCPENLPWRA